MDKLFKLDEKYYKPQVVTYEELAREDWFNNQYTDFTQVYKRNSTETESLDSYDGDWTKVEFTGHYIHGKGWLLILDDDLGRLKVVYAETIGDEFLDLELMANIEELESSKRTLEEFSENELMEELSMKDYQQTYNYLSGVIEERIANVIDFADYE